MDMSDRENTAIYQVVVNHEGQHSIWPIHQELPLGWQDVNKSGLKQECLEHIEAIWTDMRPLSLQKRMKNTPNKA